MKTMNPFRTISRQEFAILLVSLVLSSIMATAQSPYIRHYSTDDGLPSNFVYHVYQDSRNFIWFATDAGVARYDGSRFDYFTKSNGLSSNNVIKIKEDSRGRIWFFNLNASLNYLYHDSIHNEKNTPFLDSLKSKDFFRDFYEDENKTIYFYYNFYREIYSLDSQNTIIKYTYPSVTVHASPGKIPAEGMVIRYMKKSNTGEFYLWTIAGLYQLKNLADKPILVSDTFTYKGIYQVSQKDTWMITRVLKTETEESPWVIRKYTDGFIPDPTSAPLISKSFLINSIWEASDGILWISTYDKGVLCFRNGKLIRHFDIREGQTGIQDHENNIWVSSLKEGVYKISPYIHQHTHYENSLFQGIGILALDDHLENGIWCTNGRTVFLLRDNELYTTDFQNMRSSFNQLLHTKRNTLIVSEENAYPYALKGISLDHSARKIRFLKSDLYPVPLKKMISNQSKDKVSANSTYVFYLLDPADPFRHAEQVYLGERIYNIMYNTKNELLINAKRNYLYQNDSLVIFDELSRFDNKIITDHLILNDSVELLNIEGDSLFLLCHKKLFNLTAGFDYRDDLQIRNIAYHAPMLFLATNQHIFICEHPLNILSADTVPFQPVDLQFRNIHDILFDDDRLYVASDDGLSAIPYPGICDIVTQSPVPYFRSIQINDRDYTRNHTGIVLRGRNRVQIQLGSINYSFSPAIYSYMLEGADKQWSTGQGTDLLYQNLPVGDYTFRMRVRKTSSDWSEPVEFAFHVRPTFWRHPLFLVAVMILLGGLLSLRIIIRKNAQIRRRELDHQMVILEQKALQSIMNPHFIFNVLGSIQNFLLQNKSAEAGTYLLKFARLIRQNITTINSPMVRLIDEMERLRNYLDLERLRMGNKFDYLIQKEDTVQEALMRIPSMIIQPYVENAVWHGLSSLTELGRIEILFRLIKPDLLQITVRDNGIGMKRSSGHLSNSESHLRMGMAMTRRRLEIIGRKYNVESSVTISEAYPGNPNPGTLVVIIVPVSYAGEKGTREKSGFNDTLSGEGGIVN